MNTTHIIKKNIKKTFQQFADEPLEILKTVKNQITNEKPPDLKQENPNSNPNDNLVKDGEYEKKKAESEGRTLLALENELKDIRRQKLFADLVKKVQNGEGVSVEAFPELSYEQKDVLKAQIEAFRKQKLKDQNTNTFVEPPVKRGRRLFGQKQTAQKQTTRVEKPVPPSG